MALDDWEPTDQTPAAPADNTSAPDDDWSPVQSSSPQSSQQDDWTPASNTDDNPSGAGAFARHAVLGAGGAGGAAVGGTLGAIAGQALIPIPGVGAIVGGLAGGALGGAAGGWTEDKILDALGLREGTGELSSAQQQSDEAAHPYLSEAGNLASNLVGFNVGGAASKLGRATGAAIMGGSEAAQEELNEGKIDPTKVALSAGAGALLNHPRGWVEGVTAPVTSRFSPAVTSDGSAGEEHSPPQQDSSVGNEGFAAGSTHEAVGPRDPLRNYGKGSTPESAGVPGAPSSPSFNTDEIDPTISAATGADSEKSVQNSSVGATPAVSVPAAPDTGGGEPAPSVGDRPATGGSSDTGTIQAQSDQDNHTPQVKAAASLPPSVDPVDASQIQRRALDQTTAQARNGQGLYDYALSQNPDWKPSSVQGVDNAHTVVSGADKSDTTGQVFIDHRIPEFSPELKNLDGTPFNIHEPLVVHETIEAQAEANGMPYDSAHTNRATPAERQWVESKVVGPDKVGSPEGEAAWKTYTEEMDGYLNHIENSSNDFPPPTHLASNPETDIGHHRSDNKTSPGPMADVSNRKVVQAFLARPEITPKIRNAFLRQPADAQLRLATKGLAMLTSKTGEARGTTAIRTPSKRPIIERTGKEAGSATEVKRANSVLDAAEAAQKAHLADIDHTKPPEDLAGQAELVQRAKAADDAAKSLHGADWYDRKHGFRPTDQSKVPAYQELVAARKLSSGRPTAAKVKEFISQLGLIRGGAGEEAQNTGKIEGDIAFQKKPAAAQENISKSPFEANEEQAPDMLERWEHETPKDERTEGEQIHEDNVNDIADWYNALSDNDKALINREHPENGVEKEFNRAKENNPVATLKALKDDLAAAKSKSKPAPEPQRAAINRNQMPQNLADATSALLKKMGVEEPPPEAAKAINAGVKPDTVPRTTRSAVEKYLLRTNIGNIYSKLLSVRGRYSPLASSSAALIRKNAGIRQRTLESYYDAIEPLRPIVNTLPKDTKIEFQKAMQAGNVLQRFPQLQPLADVLSKQYKDAADRIKGANLLNPEDFLENYFPQMWEDNEAGRDFLRDWFAKQGSKSPLMQRKFPTIADGMNAGLKPKFYDPIEATTNYMNRIEHFIEMNRTLDEGMQLGYVHNARQAGDVELMGRTKGGLRMYAPADWARNYNNFYDPGIFHSTEEGGKLYDTARRATNFMTSIELAGPVFHTVTMAGESIISKAASALSLAAGGDFKTSLKRLSEVPFAPVSYYKRAAPFREAYLDSTKGSPETQRLVKIFTEAGGRMIGFTHDPTYELAGSPMDNYFKAWQRGSLKDQAGEAWERVKEPYNTYNPKTLKGAANIATRTPVAIAGQVFHNLGRVMQTISAPLFEHYIPNVKTGVAMEQLSDWMRLNPNASDDEATDVARRIVDSTDNRLGEMIQDNIFWNKTLKESAQLMMRSYSWNLGTVGEIGGGAAKFATAQSRRNVLSAGHQDYDPRVAYTLALPLVVATTSAIYQYMKTGKPPESPADLVAGRSGGTLKSGNPERTIFPGYEKDVLGWFNDPTRTAANKLATVPRLVWETLTNKDWRDDPIADENFPFATRLSQYAQHVWDSASPIYLRQITKPSGPSSNISGPERALSLRPAPSWLSGDNPAQQKAIERAWKTKEFHDREAQQFSP